MGETEGRPAQNKQKAWRVCNAVTGEGGGVLLPRAGFEYHNPSGQVRFQFGLEAFLGRLQPNRLWNADTETVDVGPRSDGAVGLFAGWILRLQARSTSVDYFY